MSLSEDKAEALPSFVVERTNRNIERDIFKTFAFLR